MRTLMALCLLTGLILAGCLPSSEQISGTANDAGDSLGQVFQPTKWEYSETTNLNMIPPGPVKGKADGRPFEIKSVCFQPYFDNWSLELFDTAPKEPLDISFATEYIKIDLPKDIKAGSTFHHPMDWAGGESLFQIKTKEGDGTTSWNSNASWSIEITQWDVKPYNPDGDVFQVAGTASGKVYICYQGSAGFMNSGVAGHFQNAIVRYMGPPDW